MNLEDINVLNATSDGIMEEGTIIINFKGKEFILHIEEFNDNKGFHYFRVFLDDEEDNKVLNLEIDHEWQIMDDEFVDFIHEMYQHFTLN